MTLNEDPRPITGIYYPEDCSQGYTVGRQNVKAIVVYMEYGQMSGVPWFEVRNNDDIVTARINAAHVTEVTYL